MGRIQVVLLQSLTGAFLPHPCFVKRLLQFHPQDERYDITIADDD